MGRVPEHAPLDQKKRRWLVEDEARAREQACERAEQEAIAALEAALRARTTHDVARTTLADLHLARMRRLEGVRREAEAAEEGRAERIGGATIARFIHAPARLRVVTTPPGAPWSTDRFRDRDRQLVRAGGTDRRGSHCRDRFLAPTHPVRDVYELVCDAAPSELERTEAAIRLIYDVAATRRSHLNAAMNAKAFWKQVRRVAAELGWITVGKRERLCPACGSRTVLRIVYGYPGEELQEAARRGEVVLGGCCIEDGQPLVRCGACGHEWGARAPSRRRTVRKPGRQGSPVRRDDAGS